MRSGNWTVFRRSTKVTLFTRRRSCEPTHRKARCDNKQAWSQGRRSGKPLNLRSRQPPSPPSAAPSATGLGRHPSVPGSRFCGGNDIRESFSFCVSIHRQHAIWHSSRSRTATPLLTAPIPAARRNQASKNSAGPPGVLKQARILYESGPLLLQLISPSPGSGDNARKCSSVEPTRREKDRRWNMRVG